MMLNDNIFIIVVVLFLIIIALTITAIVLVVKKNKLVYCPKCKYYYPPVCTFFAQLPMTSRKGFCYHGKHGKYEGDIPTIKST